MDKPRLLDCPRAERKNDIAPPRRNRTAAVAAGLGFIVILGVAVAGAAGRLRTVQAPGVEGTRPPSRAGTRRFRARRRPRAPPERYTAVTGPPRAEPDARAGALQARISTGTDVRAVVGALRGLFPFQRARPGDQLRLERREGEGAPRTGSATGRGPRTSGSSSAATDGALRATKRPVVLTTEVARGRGHDHVVAVRGPARGRRGPEPRGPRGGRARVGRGLLPGRPLRRPDADGRREGVFADGKLLRYGEVRAAEYEGAATGRKRLFRYADPARRDELLRRGRGRARGAGS